MSLIHGLASQKLTVLALDETANPVTGDAANITCKLSKDYSSFAALNDTNPTELESGYYEFDLTALEVTADHIRFIPVSSTANVSVTEVAGESGYTVSNRDSVKQLVSSINNSASKNLSVGVDGTTAVHNILGKYPVAGTASCESEIDLAADTWLSLCPLERDNTVYIDPENGSDSNDGLTENTPKQTISAINTALSTQNTALLLKAGTTLRTSTQITPAPNCTISRYGSGKNPRITALQDVSLTWANATGDRWTATLANASWIHPQEWNAYESLSVAASTAEVEANDESCYIDGSTLHVNMGSGIDPNNFTWEATLNTDVGDNKSGIYLSNADHGVRVDSIQCDHNGFGIFAGTVNNQSWGLFSELNNENVCAVTNCQFYTHSLHNFGQALGSGSGGRMVADNISFGSCKQDLSKLFVSYAFAGDNESILRDCKIVAGKVHDIGDNDTNNVEGVFSHSGDGSDVGFQANLRCENVAGKHPCQNIGAYSDCFDDNGDYKLSRALHIKPRQHLYTGAQTIPIVTNNAYVSGIYQLRPYFNSARALDNAVSAGSALSCIVDIDWDICAPSAGTGQFGWVNSTNTSAARGGRFKLYNCTIKQSNTSGTNTRFMMEYDSGLSSFLGELQTKSINCIWIWIDPTKTNGAELAFGDINSVAVGSGEYTNNIVFGVRDFAQAERFTSAWSNTTRPSQEPLVYDITPDAIGTGIYSAADGVEVDVYGRPLKSPGSNIGPWGAYKNSGSLNSGLLTPSQETLLDSISTNAANSLKGDTSYDITTSNGTLATTFNT